MEFSEQNMFANQPGLADLGKQMPALARQASAKPDQAAGWANLGVALRSTGHFPGGKLQRIILALSALCMVLQPCLAEELTVEEQREISSYIGCGKIRMAHRKVANLLDRDPKSPSKNLLMLQLYEHEGDLAASIRQAEKCLELKPESFQSYANLWYLMVVKRDYPAAEYYAREALEAHDLEDEYLRFRMHLKLAFTLYQESKVPESLEILKQATKCKQVDKAVFLATGDILLRKRSYEEAISSFKRALELDPRDAQTWVYLGTAQLLLGDLEQADRSFKKATEITNKYTLEKKCRRAEIGLKYSRIARHKRNIIDYSQAISRLLGKPLQFLDVPWPDKIHVSICTESKKLE
jgi:tetratricopeptide (TPR) repeat protein